MVRREPIPVIPMPWLPAAKVLVPVARWLIRRGIVGRATAGIVLMAAGAASKRALVAVRRRARSRRR